MPTACEKSSTDACACTDWDAFTAMASKARMVERGDCVVVEKGTAHPVGLEGGIGFALGLCLAMLWAILR